MSLFTVRTTNQNHRHFCVPNNLCISTCGRIILVHRDYSGFAAINLATGEVLPTSRRVLRAPGELWGHEWEYDINSLLGFEFRLLTPNDLRFDPIDSGIRGWINTNLFGYRFSHLSDVYLQFCNLWVRIVPGDYPVRTLTAQDLCGMGYDFTTHRLLNNFL